MHKNKLWYVVKLHRVEEEQGSFFFFFFDINISVNEKKFICYSQFTPCCTSVTGDS